jgi:tRNA-modifying protein YgfZ
MGCLMSAQGAVKSLVRDDLVQRGERGGGCRAAREQLAAAELSIAHKRDFDRPKGLEPFWCVLVGFLAGFSGRVTSLSESTAVEATTQIELDGQYRALREEAGFLERSGRGMVLVKGPDALEYLQGQLTNDIEALEPGNGCYSALLDRKGHMQGDMRVLRLHEDDVWLDTEREATDRVLRHLQMYSVGREVEIEDASGAWAIVSVIGPAAAELAGTPAPSPEHAQRYFEREGIEILAVATDLGLDLIARSDQADALRRLLSGSGAAEVSEDAAEIVRVESGRPRFGKEMTERTIPQEAGINERAVSFTKGCYIGQETVARLHYRGKPNRQLRGLRLSAPARGGDPVVLGEKELGQVGTAVVSPAHGAIALAILRREAEPGASVRVGDGIEATVADPTFG